MREDKKTEFNVEAPLLIGRVSLDEQGHGIVHCRRFDKTEHKKGNRFIRIDTLSIANDAIEYTVIDHGCGGMVNVVFDQKTGQETERFYIGVLGDNKKDILITEKLTVEDVKKALQELIEGKAVKQYFEGSGWHHN